jgi:hypothetical protein
MSAITELWLAPSIRPSQRKTIRQNKAAASEGAPDPNMLVQSAMAVVAPATPLQNDTLTLSAEQTGTLAVGDRAVATASSPDEDNNVGLSVANSVELGFQAWYFFSVTAEPCECEGHSVDFLEITGVAVCPVGSLLKALPEIVLAALSLPTATSAARISIGIDQNGNHYLSLDGSIAPGDPERFAAAVFEANARGYRLDVWRWPLWSVVRHSVGIGFSTQEAKAMADLLSRTTQAESKNSKTMRLRRLDSPAT